jgi:hypothetical protein
MVERVLGHRLPGIAGTYNRHAYVEQVRVALERWERHLASLT